MARGGIEVTGRVRTEWSLPRPRGAAARRAAAALVFLPLLQAVIGLPARASGPELPPPATPVLGSPGSLLLLTDPPGARAWIGGRFLGTTPVRADSLAPGRVELVLAAFSADTRWRRPRLVYADVRAGAVETVRLDLRHADVDLPMGGEPALVRAELRGTRPSLARVGTVLPVAALGLGAAGAWSRQVADRAYRDYRRTLDRGLMDDRFRRARRMDRVSVACWIGAEACLAGATWVWLRGDDHPSLSTSIDGEGTVRLGLRVDGKPPPAPGRQDAP
jgi:hypothetical protein